MKTLSQLIDAAHGLCVAIEGFPASKKQTAVAIMAADLRFALTEFTPPAPEPVPAPVAAPVPAIAEPLACLREVAPKPRWFVNNEVAINLDDLLYVTRAGVAVMRAGNGNTQIQLTKEEAGSLFNQLAKEQSA